MQTSSCDKFNETFRHMQNAAEYNKTLKKSITVQYPDPDQILEAAENKYVQLTSLQQWDGVTTKGSPSGFILENSRNSKTRRQPPRNRICLRIQVLRIPMTARNRIDLEKASGLRQSKARVHAGILITSPCSTISGPRDGFPTGILLLPPPKELIKQPMRLLLCLHLLPLLPLLLHLATSQLAILQLIKLPPAMQLMQCMK